MCLFYLVGFLVRVREWCVLRRLVVVLPLIRDRYGGWKSVACALSAILISVLLDVFGFLSQCSNKVGRRASVDA
ncbi:hypothetical protein E2C01_009023 [Portunus trituberculatus]|uniref:Uncharacterized protein n=1 Tax=Portunus trituberculatus TaxID=210409 RepID=A0A5B7D5N7_PORTR|nr:hypothetical protein [Portunus trituberculatus]